MRKTLLLTAASLMIAGSALAEEANIGIILGFTGPIESLTPAMRDAAMLALEEVNQAGGAGGITLNAKTADSTCVDATAATTAAETLVSGDKVAAIMGADCSGVTTAIVNNVSVVSGVTTISPSATTPALTTIEDKGLFFRTAPSDARQGEVLSNVLTSRGVKNVAVTFSNSDYGKGFAESFAAAYEKEGGKITISAPHDDGKNDYSAELAALAAAGGDVLVVLGYVDQGGAGIIQAALDTGAFSKFAMGDGMYGDSLTERFGDKIDGSFGTMPMAQGEGKDKFSEAATAKGIDAKSAFTGESYDAAALIALSIAAAGSADRAGIAGKVLDVANEPGEKILAGELAKGLEILGEGGEIDYVGATNVELVGPGEARGTYLEYELKGGKFEEVKFH